MHNCKDVSLIIPTLACKGVNWHKGWATLINKKRCVHGKHKVHVNSLENCQTRYSSNPLMGQTRTDGPDEQAIEVQLYRENMKNSSCLKPQGRELWFLFCSITSWTSTTFVQIIPMGPKMAQPQGSHGLHRLNRKTWKKLLVWNHMAFDM